MFVRLLLSLCLLLPAACVFAEDSAATTPENVVKQMIDDVLSSIRQDREIALAPARMNELVGRKILPEIDFSRMTRQTVGSKYWNAVTEPEQQQLTDEFRTLLAHTFSNALAQYTDQTVLFMPSRARPGADEAMVRSIIMDPRDESTRLDFRLEKAGSGWLIYDLSIDGMSLIRIYRSNFGNELLQGGVTRLIGVLHKKNQDAEIPMHS